MADIRNDCLNLIVSILEDKRPSHLVISEYLDKHKELENVDRSFVKRLVQGTVERLIMLDYAINKISSTKTNKMKPAIRNLMRMGAYQLLYMNVPDSAACNESVKIAKKRGFSTLGGFVNGVLRNIARNKDSLLDLSGIKDDITRLSLEYSMPEWLVQFYSDNYGIEAAHRAFEYYLNANHTFIRCNTFRISPEELAERLEKQGIAVRRTDIDKCMKISGYTSLNDIPEFREGLFSVQDMSSVMAGEIADVEPGMKVLDLCAAPGGKSMNLADRLLFAENNNSAEKAINTNDTQTNTGSVNGGTADDAGNVISCDISEQKVRLIEENIIRCGFKNIHTRVNDATVFVPEFENGFDIVIADVPCSGLGIIGRKPDIKYNMTPEGQKELVALQQKILDNALRYVRPDGQLLFSTCTVNSAENEDNVRYIENKGFSCILQKQLLPGENGTDGFFYAKLRRS